LVSSESFVACVILKITHYESNIKLLAVSTVNFSLTQVQFYLKYTKVNSAKFLQFLQVRSVHFSKPNLDSSTTHTMEVHEITAASEARDSGRCYTFA